MRAVKSKRVLPPTMEEVKAAVEQYQNGVLSGEIITGKLVRQAVERHVRDLANGRARDLWFSENKGYHAVAFFRVYARHSKGKWGGDPFELSPWQTWMTWVLFGWQKKNDDGDWYRRFRSVYIEVARKGGKSTYLAALGLYLLAFDGEAGAEVYTAATKRDQAKIIWEESARMVRKSPGLRKKIKPFRSVLKVPSTDSKFEPLGADDKTADGLSPHGALVDELHAHKSRGMWEVLETGVGARAQSMLIAITTAGTDTETICWEVRGYIVKILNGTNAAAKSDSWFGLIYCIDDDDDPLADETCWIKANPNLGITPKISELRAQVDYARAVPGGRNKVLRLRFNRWTQQDTLAIPMEDWNACSDRVDEEALAGRECYGGLDLSKTGDLTAWVLLFPPKEEGELWKILPRFWLPEDTIAKKAGKDRENHELWVEQGFLAACDGPVIDYIEVERQIISDSSKFGLIDAGFDPWNAMRTYQQLRASGIELVAFNQRMGNFNEPTKMLIEMVMTHKFAHGGHPVLNNNISNLSTKEDDNGNLRPVKPKRQTGRRIDGAVALIMALGRATLTENGPSVYESRPMTVL